MSTIRRCEKIINNCAAVRTVPLIFRTKLIKRLRFTAEAHPGWSVALKGRLIQTFCELGCDQNVCDQPCHWALFRCQSRSIKNIISLTHTYWYEATSHAFKGIPCVCPAHSRTMINSLMGNIRCMLNTVLEYEGTRDRPYVREFILISELETDRWC